MPNDTTQMNAGQDMTPDEAAAALAHSTKLSDAMMPQDPNAQMTDSAPDQKMDESMIDQKIDEKLKPIADMLQQLLDKENGQTES